MNHTRKAYLAAGIFFALCAINALLTDVSALYAYGQAAASMPNVQPIPGFWRHMLFTTLTSTAPLLLLMLYCFFLHRTKAAPWVYCIAFCLLMAHSVSNLAQHFQMKSISLLSVCTVGLFLLFCIAMVLWKLLRTKALAIISGILLGAYLLLSLWQQTNSFVQSAKLMVQVPSERIMLLLMYLPIFCNWVAYALLWQAEARDSACVADTPSDPSGSLPFHKES